MSAFAPVRGGGFGGSGGNGGDTPGGAYPRAGPAAGGSVGGPSAAAARSAAAGAELLAMLKGPGGGGGGAAHAPPGLSGAPGYADAAGAGRAAGGVAADGSSAAARALGIPGFGGAAAANGGGGGAFGGTDGGGAAAAAAPAPGGGGGPSPGAYGLLGLLQQMRGGGDGAAPPLSLGVDVGALGLATASAEPLHPTFAYPWGDVPATREPAYALPACYKMPQPALKTGHLARFEPATLFYIFYGMPRDVLQAYAAQELYARGWRFHAELKTWFRQEPPAAAGAAGATAADAGKLVYWDSGAWEKRVYGGPAPPAALAAGFLAEDEVKVSSAAKN